MKSNKIDKMNLSRGVKLAKEHVAPLTDIATNLDTQDVTPDQLVDNKGSFRISIPITYIDGSYILKSAIRNANQLVEVDVGNGTHTIPFVVPLSQDNWSEAGQRSSTDPKFTVVEISISSDTGDENVAIASQYYNDSTPDFYTAFAGGSPDTGKFVYSELAVEKSLYTVSLLEKTPQYYKGSQRIDESAEETQLTRRMFSFKVPSLEVLPIAIPVTLDLDPYKTYAIKIEAPSRLGDFDLDESAIGPRVDMLHSLVLNNMFISLKVESDLLPTPTAGTIQNFPETNWDQSKTTISLTTINDGDLIKAESQLQNNLDVVSENLSVIKGHIDARAHIATLNESLANSMVPHVIAVPLFANQHGNIVNAKTIPFVANVGVSPYANSIMDRRYVKIDQPMIIDHVVLGMNWQSANLFGLFPTANGTYNSASGITYKVGVGVSNGLASDDFTYEQIAYRSFSLADVFYRDSVIDRIGSPAGDDWGVQFDWELLPIFMNRTLNDGNSFTATASGTGQFKTGTPFFVGGNTSLSTVRSNVGLNTNGSTANAATSARYPSTAGNENFLEVRMAIVPTTDFDTDIYSGSSASATLVGYGGHMLYIIGRKYLLS